MCAPELFVEHGCSKTSPVGIGLGSQGLLGVSTVYTSVAQISDNSDYSTTISYTSVGPIRLCSGLEGVSDPLITSRHCQYPSQA